MSGRPYYCDYCGKELMSQEVTFDERCTTCGNRVGGEFAGKEHARVRELEAQAVRDAKVIEAARAYRIAQQAIASACSPPFDPGVCTDAMVAQDEAEATLDAALAEREE